MNAPTSELSKEAYELAVVNYGHIEQQAGLAATKAALLVAAQALLLTIYVGAAKDFGVFYYYKGSVLSFIFAFAGISILLALFLSLYAIFPKSKPDSDQDLLFFASINDNFASAGEYVASYRLASTEELDRQLLENIHGKACWLRRNFWFVRASIFMTFLGVLVATVSFLIMSPILKSAA